MPITTFLNNRPFVQPRGLIWMSLSDEAVIQTRTVASDGGGGGTIVWTAAGTTICRIYPVTLRGKGGLVGGVINERTTHFCALPPDTLISTSDRVMIPGRGTFEVTIGLETTSAFTTRVEVIEIDY